MITTLNGCYVTITGRLKKMERATAFRRISLEGGTPQQKITKATDILVIADEKRGYGTIKKGKADKWFTEVISEADFYELIGA